MARQFDNTPQSVEPDTLEVAAKQSEARELHVVRNMRRGEDTLAPDENTVVFSDFRPKVEKSEEEVALPAPKDSSAPEPVVSPESLPKLEGTTETIPVPTPAPKGSGTPSQSESGSQGSSSAKKSG